MVLLAIMTVLVFPLQGQTERRPLRMMARDILDLTPEQEARFDEMAKARRAERQKAELRHRMEMRKILTPEQLKKLDEYRDSFRDRGRNNRMRAFGRRMGRFGGGFLGRGFRFHRRWR
jgi:Spy/CpxP family protein refolding chaperone